MDVVYVDKFIKGTEEKIYLAGNYFLEQALTTNSCVKLVSADTGLSVFLDNSVRCVISVVWKAPIQQEVLNYETFVMVHIIIILQEKKLDMQLFPDLKRWSVYLTDNFQCYDH